MQVVINTKRGPFDVSLTATRDFGVDKHTLRSDARLIKAVRTLGPAVDGPESDLQIVATASERWHIVEHDGYERVVDGHPPEIRRGALRFQIWQLHSHGLTDAELAVRLGRDESEITEVQG